MHGRPHYAEYKPGGWLPHIGKTDVTQLNYGTIEVIRTDSGKHILVHTESTEGLNGFWILLMKSDGTIYSFPENLIIPESIHEEYASLAWVWAEQGQIRTITPIQSNGVRANQSDDLNWKNLLTELITRGMTTTDFTNDNFVLVSSRSIGERSTVTSDHMERIGGEEALKKSFQRFWQVRDVKVARHSAPALVILSGNDYELTPQFLKNLLSH